MHRCQPAQHRAEGVLSGCPCPWTPIPKGVSLGHLPQVSEARPEISRVPRLAARPSGLHTPETDEAGKEKSYLDHKACLCKVCRPQRRCEHLRK